MTRDAVRTSEYLGCVSVARQQNKLKELTTNNETKTIQESDIINGDTGVYAMVRCFLNVKVPGCGAPCMGRG